MNPLLIVHNLLKKHTLSVVIGVALLTISGFIEASSILGITPIIDMIIHNEIKATSVFTQRLIKIMQLTGLPISVISFICIYLLVVTIRNIINYFSRSYVVKLHFRVIRELIIETYDSFISSSWTFFIKNKHGVLGNTLIRETDKVGLLFEEAVGIFSNLLKVVFYLSIAIFISWKLTLTAILLVGIVLIPFSLFGKITYRAGKIHTQAANQLQELILETFSGAKLILGFGNIEKCMVRLEQIVLPYIDSAIKFVIIRLITPLGFEPLGISIVLATFYIGVYKLNMKISVLFVLLYSLKMTTQLALEIVSCKNSFVNKIPALMQIQGLIDDSKKCKQSNGSVLFDKLQKGISLKNVCFSFNGGDKVLDNVNINIPKGQMIALIGKSGDGKTTISDILMGFFAVTEGEVLIDDMSIKQLDITSWRKKIGFVPQDPFLFHSTIRENILWGSDKASDEDIIYACTLSNANEFIENLPLQLDTVVGDRGIRLSGGQRQRIALARSLVRRPDILILDEATSSLDSHSELLIQKSIENVSKITTVFVIAHRLSTIKNADCIYVLEKGKIVEYGNFDELLAKENGSFRKMANLQGLTK